MENAGYTNLIRSRIGADAYSYVFDGQWGYLDYAFGSASIQPQVAAVHEWHINSDEPAVLDYNTEFKTAGQVASLYAPDEFRISDHDPVIVDLALTPPPESSTTTLTVTPTSQVYGTQSPATWSTTVALSRHGDAVGQVQVLDDGDVIASAEVVDGVATGSVPAFLAAGVHQLTAKFVPDDPAGSIGSTSEVTAFTVSPAQSTTDLSTTVGKVKTQGGSAEFLLDMTATVRLETRSAPVGTVVFSVDGRTMADAAVVDGVARATVSAAKGTHEVLATFRPADPANIVGSDSAVQTVRVK